MGLAPHWLNFENVPGTELRSSTNQMPADLVMLFGFLKREIK